MSVKNNETLKTSQILMDIDTVKDAIIENSKGVLNNMLSESVRLFMKEAINGADDDSEDKENDFIETAEDSIEGETETQEASETEDEGDGDAEDAEEVEETGEETETEAEDDGIEGIDQYEVEDDTYDLTGVEDKDYIVRVYKLMKDDDEVSVVKGDDGKIELKDNGTGAEYVIDLGNEEDSCEGEDCEEAVFECITEDLENDPAGLPEETVTDSEDSDLDVFVEKEIENEGKENNEETIVEMDLGFTDNYQKNDVIKGLSNAEPSKSGRTWDKGVPTGTEKPWAGETKSKGEPFEETVNEEVEEGTNVGGAVQQRSNSKSHIPANRKEHGPKVKRHVSTAGEYDEMVENIKKQNKYLKESLRKLHKNLMEAQVANVSLAKITKLFTENAVTSAEKKEIVERFSSEVKSVEAANSLYESYKARLASGTETKKLTLENKNEVAAVEDKSVLNESNNKELLNTLDLIRRVEEL